ncbi:alpha/beta hydrolase fold domain-containing protein [Pseudochelatococcus lubricantis]|uniref:alpha/beta hydrolase fold domain-containing protein n=1 Tax=Pseudochelatococcus lubricantis TaxID=1538102 RepID=UPI0035EA777B
MAETAAQELQPVLSVFWREESLNVRGEIFFGRLYVSAKVPEHAGLVLHLHGGHFNSGSPAEGQAVAAALTEAGAVVFSLSYPLAPAHRFPETLELIYAALEALARGRSRWVARGAPLYVAGEEAGGNLAAALAMMARDRGGPALAGQILLSPMLDACLATASLRGAQAGPVGCCWADGWAAYLGTPERAAHPYAAPLQATRLAGLPPALLISAQDDPMRDEAAQYAARLGQAGVHVRHIERAAPTHWPQAYADAPEEGSCLCKTCGEIAAFYGRTAPS